MIFPKKDSVYQNLNTSFTNFGELLLDLKENSFTGVVQVSYWEYEGLLLLDNGNIINAIEDINGNILSGQNAVKGVTEKAKEKDGAISVFSQKGDMITMLASVAISEVIYENLSTEFTSLKALISKLQNEDHTGYIEVSFEGAMQAGYIFLLAGEVIEALLTSRGTEVSGIDVLSRIIELASASVATFCVYRAAVEEALSDSEIIRVTYDLPQLLELWGIVISTVENAVDSLLGENTFLNTFKDTLIQKADEYPFLDPFAAKFKYQDGSVAFHGEVKMNFSQGVGAGLSETIETLAKKAALDGMDILSSVRDALDPVKEEYQGKLDRFNFSAILPNFFS